MTLLEDYWVRRKYHHTMSASLVYALREALVGVEEEGLHARWARHEQNHLAFVKKLDRLGLQLLPSPADRLWTLNAVSVPQGVDDAAVRKHLLQHFNIEIGAGLGPLAGKVFRIGLMGTSSSQELVDLLSGALEQALNEAAVRKA
jgi:alanine-glyoxylate transaminase/serine-glyoxylate transaminase/serine-pyruvate transaminase